MYIIGVFNVVNIVTAELHISNIPNKNMLQSLNKFAFVCCHKHFCKTIVHFQRKCIYSILYRVTKYVTNNKMLVELRYTSDSKISIFYSAIIFKPLVKPYNIRFMWDDMFNLVS